MKKLIYTTLAATAICLTGCVNDASDGVSGEKGSAGMSGEKGGQGLQGATGLNSLVIQTALAKGNKKCPIGGTQIDSGLDDNSNGLLDRDEIDTTEFVCGPSVLNVASSNPWYVAGKEAIDGAQNNIKKVINDGDIRGKAKNVILFVGDGMGVSTVTAARILDGQKRGMAGEENLLSFDKFPFTGFSKTYNVNAQTPDSAGTMTALITGVKTDAGVIGVHEDVERGNCSTVAGNELVTALELAELSGKSTGIVSTARITHATPAATYAKSADRNWEDISDLPEEAINSGCKDIADQLIRFEENIEARFSTRDIDGIEVVMGGGRRHFLPKDESFNSADATSAIEGDRTDGRDLTAEWKAKYNDGDYVFDKVGFDAIDGDKSTRVFGLFNESHMRYEADRANDISGEPSLSEMTAKAIDVLDNNENGFFLMVESGRIDHAHHAGNASNALVDTIEFSKAVQAAVDATNEEETLIIVTADHSHVFTIAGYPKRGNPILGKVVPVGSNEPSLAADNMPYTTLGYTNGRGFRDYGAETDADVVYDEDSISGRVDLISIGTTLSGFHQETLVPLSSETHAGEDVGVYARGPGAHLVTGTNEQNAIFHVMNYAGDLVNKASVSE